MRSVLWLAAAGVASCESDVRGTDMFHSRQIDSSCPIRVELTGLTSYAERFLTLARCLLSGIRRSLPGTAAKTVLPFFARSRGGRSHPNYADNALRLQVC